jgi:integrase
MNAAAFHRLRVEAWPELDRNSWVCARTLEDPFEPGGIAADWRPTTIANIEKSWGIFLDWLLRHDLLTNVSSVSERVSGETLRRFVQTYAEHNAASSVATMVRALYDFVRACCPGVDLTELKTLFAAYKARARHLKSPAERHRPIAELIAIGHEHFEQGLAMMADTPISGAIACRTGLLFLMEVGVPLRVSNLRSLRIDHTFFKVGDRWKAVFDGSAMKNHRPFVGWYPAWLTEIIDLWIEEIRPILRHRRGAPDPGWMWPTCRAERISSKGVLGTVRMATRDKTGIAITTHAFRHSVTTQIAVSAPDQIGIVTPILGHAGPASDAVYDLARGFEAQQFWLEILGQTRAVGDQG